MELFKNNWFFTGMIILSVYGCKDDDPKPFHQNVTLDINHQWNDSALVLENKYVLEQDFNTDTITPTTLIYHINNLVLNAENNQKIMADQLYYMIDYNEKKVYPDNITFTTPKAGVKYYVTSLDFTIGVSDSLINQKGLLNSLFVSPMYWGMIQGYINFKFEGLSPRAPNNALIYHIGGYTKPFYNSRKVSVVFDKPYLLNRENTLLISANLAKLFKSKHQIDISTIDLIHTPNTNSVLIADNLATMYKFQSLK
jgi:hypothetical protein